MKFVDGAWEYVGDPGISTGQAAELSLIFDKQGTPYLAYSDAANNYKLAVRKFTDGQWQPVGGQHASVGIADNIQITFDSQDNPYILFRDRSNVNVPVPLVLKFTSGAWATVGGAPVVTHDTNEMALALDYQNTPYVVYNDGTDNYQMSVKKLNGNTWEYVGQRKLTNGQASHFSIAIGSDDIPYIAFTNQDISFRNSVIKFTGTQWETLGTSGLATNASRENILLFDSIGTLYIAYSENGGMFGGSRPQAAVRKLVGNQWQPVGGGNFTGPNTLNQVQNISFALDSKDIPYGAYRDQSAGQKATVKKLVTQYNVNYNGNGHETGSVPLDNQGYSTVSPVVTVAGNTGNMERAGYTFSHWNTAADGTGTSYNPNDTFNISNTDVTLYAQWQSGISEITFVTNGGTSILPQSVENNSKATEPLPPIRDGYKFFGWYTDMEMTQAYDFETPVTSNMTLYAKWQSENATLASLNVGQGTLDPGFMPTELDYQVDVDPEVTSLDFSFSKAESSQIVNVTGATEQSVIDDVYSYRVSNLVTGMNTVQIIVTAEEGNINTYNLIVKRTSLLSENADLGGLKLSSGTLSPAFSPDVEQYTATVSSSTSSLLVSATPVQEGASVQINSTSGNIANIALENGSNTVTIEVTAPNGSAKKTYTLLITRSISSPDTPIDNNPGSGNSAGTIGTGGASNGGAGVTPPLTNNNSSSDVQVLVNGRAESAGSLTTTTVNGKQVVRISVNAETIAQKLNSEPAGSVITIPVTGSHSTNASVIIGELNGQTVKLMEDKQAVLVLQTDTASYTLPANQIQIKSVADQLKLNSNDSLESIKLQVEIAEVDPTTLEAAKSVAQQGGYTLVGTPVEFNVIASYDGNTTSVNEFSSYVERTIALPANSTPDQMTTGVVIDKDGSALHVPTKITTINGVYYAQISSLTNSAYGLVYYPQSFTDVANHWSNTAVNDMGSRMIVSGVSDSTFEPDRSVTRAEFAAIVVRALGLKPADGSNIFPDVNETDWYAGFVKTTTDYGLISGYKDGTFRPHEQITRQEAMTLIARAMKVTGLDSQVPANAVQQLSSFADSVQVAEWAKEAVAASIHTGILTGRDSNTIAPLQSITRAETATILRRLLQQSDII
ncbi:S-layer homology domain-containing protein [Priestia sp. FSL H7-0729]